VARHARPRDCMCCQLFDVIVGNITVCICNASVGNALTLNSPGLKVFLNHRTKVLSWDPAILFSQISKSGFVNEPMRSIFIIDNGENGRDAKLGGLYSSSAHADEEIIARNCGIKIFKRYRTLEADKIVRPCIPDRSDQLWLFRSVAEYVASDFVSLAFQIGQNAGQCEVVGLEIDDSANRDDAQWPRFLLCGPARLTSVDRDGNNGVGRQIPGKKRAMRLSTLFVHEDEIS